VYTAGGAGGGEHGEHGKGEIKKRIRAEEKGDRRIHC
jgi:hypothetical protein